MLSGRDKSAATVWVGFTRPDPSDADDEDAGAQKTRLAVAGHEEMISATSVSMAFTELQGVYHPPEPPRTAGPGANRSSQSSRRTCSGILSGRSPRQLGCRMPPSAVHSVNVTSPTSRGSAQCAQRACRAGTGGLGVIAVPRRGPDRVSVQAKVFEPRPPLGVGQAEQRVPALVQQVEHVQLHHEALDQPQARRQRVHALFRAVAPCR